MTNEAKNKLIYFLKELQGDSNLFIKVYFLNEKNYTIKFIDENGNKVHTMRKITDKKIKGFDNQWWKGKENGKSHN